jgi:hypothetical protein
MYAATISSIKQKKFHGCGTFVLLRIMLWTDGKISEYDGWFFRIRIMDGQMV